nr:hypothetical protein [Heyndrickxia oleronia]
MTATIWGYLNLTITSDNALYDENIEVNEQLYVNNRFLKEHDISIIQLDSNTYEVSTVVSYNPTAQTEDEAFGEAIDAFKTIDIEKYYIEDICNNLTETNVQNAVINWQEYSNPAMGVHM